MKSKKLYILVLMSSLLWACKSNEGGPNEIELARQELLSFMAGSWIVDEVRKDNVLITDFSGFIISFNNQSFTSQNGVPVWPSSSNFSFADEEAVSSFVRADGTSFEVIRIGEALQLNVSYSEAVSRQGIEGKYQFLLSKN